MKMLSQHRSRGRLLVRADANTNAGFNLKYESASGVKGAGGWYTIPPDDAWHTQTWTIQDDQFVGKWAYHFSLDSDSKKFSRYYVRNVTVNKRDADERLEFLRAPSP